MDESSFDVRSTRGLLAYAACNDRFFATLHASKLFFSFSETFFFLHLPLNALLILFTLNKLTQSFSIGYVDVNTGKRD